MTGLMGFCFFINVAVLVLCVVLKNTLHIDFLSLYTGFAEYIWPPIVVFLAPGFVVFGWFVNDPVWRHFDMQDFIHEENERANDRANARFYESELRADARSDDAWVDEAMQRMTGPTGIFYTDNRQVNINVKTPRKRGRSAKKLP